MNLHCAQGNCYTETFFMERRNLKFRDRTRKGSNFTDSKERGLFVYIYWFLFFCTIVPAKILFLLPQYYAQNYADIL